MSFCQKQYVGIASTIRRPLKILIGIVLIIFVTACTSQVARDAELAAQQAEVAAAEQEAARIVQEQARQQEAAERQQREVAAAERAREQSERERREAEDLARAEVERRQREEVERREQQRLAAAEAERLEKLERISSLERQIASIQSGTDRNESATAVLQEAILVAEELLAVLAVEQAKYEETDPVSGYTVEPLAKERIAELEARKDDLIRRAQSQ